MKYKFIDKNKHFQEYNAQHTISIHNILKKQNDAISTLQNIFLNNIKHKYSHVIGKLYGNNIEYNNDMLKNIFSCENDENYSNSDSD